MALYDSCQHRGPQANANKTVSKKFQCLDHIALTQSHIYVEYFH